MRRFLVGFLAILGGITLAVLVGAGVFAWWLIGRLQSPATPIATETVLRIDLAGADADHASPVAAAFGAERLGVRELILTLDRAARDPKVVGVIVDLGADPPSLALAQELAPAIAKLRAAGKRTVAHADTFDVGSRGAYLLATAFEQVWLQPAGDVPAMGVALERPFLSRLLTTLGVVPALAERQEHKGGIDLFTGTTISPALRQSLGSLVEDLHTQSLGAIAEGRRLPLERVAALFAQAPLTAEAARAAGLIDRIGYRDQAEAEVRGSASIMDLEDYAASLPAPTGRKIAVIAAAGPVVRSNGGGIGSLSGEEATFAADRIADAFAAASADPDVRGILFRIDSPGGSYVASDTIARAVVRARQRGKPVVVSMASVAASGGYFAALEADRIVALPGTLTGSVGVYGGKFVIGPALDKLGVTVERIAAGDLDPGQDPLREFSPQGRAQLEASLDRVYADFTARVGRARKLEGAALDAATRGRVFTGLRARDVGLVDVIGGYEVALAELRRLADLPADQPLVLVDFPAAKPPLEQLFQLLERFGGIATWLHRIEVAFRPGVRLDLPVVVR